jgi:hypothetical protein
MRSALDRGDVPSPGLTLALFLIAPVSSPIPNEREHPLQDRFRTELTFSKTSKNEKMVAVLLIFLYI